MHCRHDILAVNHDRAIGAVAQRDVEHGPLLGEVDFFPVEHFLCPTLEIRLPGQIAQQPHSFCSDAILRIVKEDILEAQGEGVETPGVLGEEVTHVDVDHRLLVSLEGLPGGGCSQCAHRKLLY